MPPPPWRVFLSHTSELREYPPGGESYVSQAERAVAMAGHVVVDMREFPARHHPPAQLCEERVRGCDVYVGIYGLRYGSPVRKRPELSYTELEFMVAGAAGLPRLIFLLNPSSSDSKLPAKALLDRRHGDRQDAFRQRVREQGLTTALFSGPEELRLGIYQALVELAAPPAAPPVRSSPGPASRGRSGRGPSGRDSAQRGGSHDAPPDLELLAYLPDRHPQEQQLLDLLTPPRQTPSTATAKVVILHGEEDQRLEWFRRRFLPDARRFDKPPRFFPVAWPRDSPADETFQEAFQRHLRSQVVKDLPLEALRGVLENGVRPVVLISSLSASEWSPREVRRLEALCRFWSADGPFAASWLLHWITITYDKLPPSRSASHRPGLWRWLTLRRWRHRFHRWRRARHNDWIRASLSQLARAPAVAARPVVLPEVRSVSRGDAESWARSLAVRQAVGRHQVTRLEQAVMEKYRDWLAEHGVAEMPMEVLAPFLKEQVDQLRRRP